MVHLKGDIVVRDIAEPVRSRVKSNKIESEAIRRLVAAIRRGFPEDRVDMIPKG